MKYESSLNENNFVSESEDDELCHHGIKGQRWGIIRTPAQLGHFGFPRPKRHKIKLKVRVNRNDIGDPNLSKKELERLQIHVNRPFLDNLSREQKMSEETKARYKDIKKTKKKDYDVTQTFSDEELKQFSPNQLSKIAWKTGKYVDPWGRDDKWKPLFKGEVRPSPEEESHFRNDILNKKLRRLGDIVI